jgi:glycosyltransferase involved in cell wall biosynthesis
VRIAIIGKFPPIEGGVSARTYWIAHGLAARGHEVHVITNAKEVRAPFRMYMREADWLRCEATYDAGSVTVHWTDPDDRSQYYIPMASPFVSKLAAIVARVHSQHPFDVVHSYYMEPYGVAGHLVAEMTGVPHVARMAGSDAGRLWHHPQLAPLYDHVLQSAEAVVAVGAVADRAVERSVDSSRIVPGGAFVLPENVFSPFGPVLDLDSVRAEVTHDPELCDLAWGGLPPSMPYFGVYGKLGASKGSFSLLAALHRLKQNGIEVGLAALAHGPTSVEREFQAKVLELGLADRVLQLPFLPNWRVPEFLRGCLAVCCLEQGFPILFHSPMVPREVLMCGACLVGSTEIIRKLPTYTLLPDGYGCVAITDVDHIEALAEKLTAIVRDPEPLLSLRARGCAFARSLQQEVAFPQTLERVLEAAAARERVAPETVKAHKKGWTVASCSADQTSLAASVQVEAKLAVVVAANGDSVTDDDPLFRLRSRRWAIGEGAIAELVPMRAPRLQLVRSRHDASQPPGARAAEGLSPIPERGTGYIAAFWPAAEPARDPIIIDDMSARIIGLCDGTRTALQIVKELDPEAGVATTGKYLKWIEALFVHALIGLCESDFLPNASHKQ